MIDLEQPIAEAPIVVIDTETTSLDPFFGEIVEVCALRFEMREGMRVLVSKINTLIRPYHPINEDGEACKVNKITNLMVKDCPSWRDIAEDITAIVGNSVLVAHYLAFDADFLMHAHNRVDQPWSMAAGLCTKNLYAKYRRWLGDGVEDSWPQKSNRLQDILPALNPSPKDFAASFGEKIVAGSHRAQVDAWGCAALLFNHLLPYMIKGREVSVSSAMFYSGIRKEYCTL